MAATKIALLLLSLCIAQASVTGAGHRANLAAIQAAVLPLSSASAQALRGGGEGKRERTFAMIKPDAMAAGNGQHIKKLIQDAGFIIVQDKVVTLSKAKAEGFYQEHKGKPFFDGLVEFMTSGPVNMLILQKTGAIKGWRETMGPTNSVKARAEAKGSVRALYGTDGGKNAAHGSDSPKSAAREIRYMFGIVAWLKAVMPGAKLFWPK